MEGTPESKNPAVGGIVTKRERNRGSERTVWRVKAVSF
jgi:hypothetical protein